MVATLETGSSTAFYIEDVQLKPSTESISTWDLLDSGKSWMFDNSMKITGKLKLAWKDKINAALGFTHYVKKGKLFRK